MDDVLWILAGWARPRSSCCRSDSSGRSCSDERGLQWRDELPAVNKLLLL